MLIVHAKPSGIFGGIFGVNVTIKILLRKINGKLLLKILRRTNKAVIFSANDRKRIDAAFQTDIKNIKKLFGK